jgi:hypothetical protein
MNARTRVPKKVIIRNLFRLYLRKPEKTFIATLGTTGIALTTNNISFGLLSSNLSCAFSIFSQETPKFAPAVYQFLTR